MVTVAGSSSSRLIEAASPLVPGVASFRAVEAGSSIAGEGLEALLLQHQKEELALRLWYEV